MCRISDLYVIYFYIYKEVRLQNLSCKMSYNINRLRSLEVQNLLDIGNLALNILGRYSPTRIIERARMEYASAQRDYQDSLDTYTVYVNQIEQMRHLDMMPTSRTTLAERNNTRIRAQDHLVNLIDGWIQEIRLLREDELNPIYAILGVARNRRRREEEQRIMPSRAAKRRHIDYGE